jgi:hypothetical protein
MFVYSVYSRKYGGPGEGCFVLFYFAMDIKRMMGRMGLDGERR